MIPSEYSPCFNSVYADKLQSFLVYKRSIGYKYESEAHMLSRLDQYFIDDNVSELTEESLLNWVIKRKNESVKTHGIRNSVLKQFSLYLGRYGISVTLPQNTKSSGFSKSFTPYIFTKEQMEKIFYAADHMPGKERYPHKGLIIPTILRLLYGCGLRVNEALALRMRNIDFDRGLVTIMNGKNGNCRMLPLSESLKVVLTNYADRMHTFPKDDDFLFPTKKMEQYSTKHIYQTFREILWQSGIPHGGRGKGPRLHDIRHTFAVHSLQKLIFEGKDTYLLLPILSTYLGHKNIYATERYLRLTPEMYPDVLDKVQAACGKLVPEVTDYEDD